MLLSTRSSMASSTPSSIPHDIKHEGTYNVNGGARVDLGNCWYRRSRRAELSLTSYPVIPPFDDPRAIHEPHTHKQSKLSDIARNAIMTSLTHEKTKSITPKVSPKAETNGNSKEWHCARYLKACFVY